MRVLTVSPLPPKRDGIATYTAELSRAFREAGHTVGHVTTSPDQQPAGRVAVLPAVPVRVGAVADAIGAWRPDVVHVQHAVATYGPQLLALVALLWRLGRSGVPVVITHHEVTRDTDRLGPVGRWYYGFVSRAATRLHVHTDGAAERLRACLRATDRDIVVRPHPIFVPDDLESPAVEADLRGRVGDADAWIGLLIGFVQIEKGHLETVEALGTLLARRPELTDRVRVVFAGDVRRRPPGMRRFERADHEYAHRVRRRVAELDLERNVTWTGHVPDEEFTSWFRIADLVLLPYRASEESGIAGHAVAARTPVLSTEVGGLAVLFGGTPLALPGTDPSGLAAALEAAIDDPQRRRREAAEVYDGLLERRGAGAIVDAVTGTKGVAR